jgi:dimethylargininase
MPIALTREISSAIARCELTYLPRVPIDLAVARAQHAEYEKCLEDSGCRVIQLAAEADAPDCVFVEDAAVVLPEIAIVMRPGAASRRGEARAVAAALSQYRPLARIAAPGTMDGGDVLAVGHLVFVGISGRTNREGASQLRAILAPYGYEVQEVEVRGCLHLKSAVTLAGKNLLLMNSAWLPPDPFSSFDRVEVDPLEPWAANAVSVLGQVILAASLPRTHERLRKRGLQVRAVEASELAKAEGALTCCSLIFDSEVAPAV